MIVLAEDAIRSAIRDYRTKKSRLSASQDFSAASLSQAAPSPA
jgi:hypothetical protein